MILALLRVFFLLLVSIVASAYLYTLIRGIGENSTVNFVPYVVMLGGVVLAFTVFLVDVVVKRKNLAAISGLLLGLLVGLVVSLGLGILVDKVTGVFLSQESVVMNRSVIEGTKLLLGLMCCYLTVSFILQTKDDFRFIIPYVEFSRATRGSKALLLDTSVIIDGRVAELAQAGVFESRVIVPRFVLNELQAIADSSDRLKRIRGKRGLDILHRLQTMQGLELYIWDGTLQNAGEVESVDQKLILLALQEHARLVTNDSNLSKVAHLRGVSILNLHDLAHAMRPDVLPGEHMKLRVVKPGESPGQGVGYLEDGTMVVVDGGRDKIGQDVEIVITNAVQTTAGRMIFGRTDASGTAPPPQTSRHLTPRRHDTRYPERPAAVGPAMPTPPHDEARPAVEPEKKS